MKIVRNIANGILAGILISIGGGVFLACYGDGSILSRTIGSFFFSVALLCICYKKYSLYTGKIGYILEKHGKADLSVLLWGLFGNIIATVPVGLLMRYAIPSMGTAADIVCAAKLSQDWWQTLVRGIFCGFLVYLAVTIFRMEDKNYISAILIGIPTFILSGYEHSIADMFYFGAAGVLNADAIVFLALVVLGNSIGGVLMAALERIVNPPAKH